MSDASKKDLITFAGPIFDLILRLKAGIVTPSNELRPKIDGLLDEIYDGARPGASGTSVRSRVDHV